MNATTLLTRGIGAHLKYLSYVVRHKWYVFVECCKLGIPWRGLVHDLGKFSWTEWEPYVASFYGGPHRAWAEVFAWEKTYHWGPAWRSCKEGVRERFDNAWNHHQKRNKHHWQYWLLVNDEDGTCPLRMPRVYEKEMLADWRGAGRACGTPDTLAWYMKNREKVQLHPETRRWIEHRLQGVKD